MPLGEYFVMPVPIDMSRRCKTQRHRSIDGRLAADAVAAGCGTDLGCLMLRASSNKVDDRVIASLRIEGTASQQESQGEQNQN